MNIHYKIARRFSRMNKKFRRYSSGNETLSSSLSLISTLTNQTESVYKVQMQVSLSHPLRIYEGKRDAKVYPYNAAALRNSSLIFVCRNERGECDSFSRAAAFFFGVIIYVFLFFGRSFFCAFRVISHRFPRCLYGGRGGRLCKNE